MLFKKNYKTAAATFIVAIATGFVMQNSDAFASRIPAPKPHAKSVEDPQVKIAENLPLKSEILPVATPVLGDQPKTADPLSVTEQKSALPNLPSNQEYSAFGVACDVTLEANKSAGGIVILALKAPCHVNETVIINHQGLSFTAITSDIGHFTAQVPAFAEMAKFDAELIDGSLISTTLVVPDVSEYERVALQWKGDSGLKIHALEMGADYGERGHVWAKSPQSIATALQARGGYITELGASGFPGASHIEIYSFPTGQIQKTGVVRLSVEAEVTARTCNKEIKAQALQSGVDGSVSITDLTLVMPDCDAIGDFLVLNNLLRDLKIAQN